MHYSFAGAGLIQEQGGTTAGVNGSLNNNGSPRVAYHNQWRSSISFMPHHRVLNANTISHTGRIYIVTSSSPRRKCRKQPSTLATAEQIIIDHDVSTRMLQNNTIRRILHPVTGPPYVMGIVKLECSNLVSNNIFCSLFLAKSRKKDYLQYTLATSEQSIVDYNV